MKSQLPQLVSHHPQFVSRSAKNALHERRYKDDGFLSPAMCPMRPRSFFVGWAVRKHCLALHPAAHLRRVLNELPSEQRR